MKLGTTFALWIAKPVVRKIDGTFGTDLENCVGCNKREQQWNAFGENIINWLTNKGDKMADENEEIEYLLQVSVKAVDLKDASSKITGGKIISGGPMPKVQSGRIQGVPATQGQVITRTQGQAVSQSGK